MREEKSSGVFGAVNGSGSEKYGDFTAADLVVVKKDSPESIYNLLFRKYDEENAGK